MPIVQADRLTVIAAELMQGAGASEEEAAIVSRHSIGANLAGHDSHGIIAIPTYIDRIKRGHIVPGAPFARSRRAIASAPPGSRSGSDSGCICAISRGS